MKLRSIDTIIFDLNGTLYEKGIAVKGAIDTINQLRSQNYNLNFITNTDGRSIKSVLNRVIDMGFDIKEEELLTPVSAARRFIEYNPNKKYYLLVNEEVYNDLSHGNIDEENPDYVIVGDFRDKLNYDEVNKVFRMLVNGAEIISLSNTTWYYGVDGKNINTGAFVKMFEIVSEKTAILLGKPSIDYFKMALKRTDSIGEKTLVIGDDITTDIYGAKELDSTAVLVKTGVYDKDKIKSSKVKPDYVIDSVNELLDIL